MRPLWSSTRSRIANEVIQSDRSDKLQVSKTGTGGLTELQENLDNGKASYAYVRVMYANDKESKREKFILVVRVKSCASSQSTKRVPCTGLDRA